VMWDSRGIDYVSLLSMEDSGLRRTISTLGASASAIFDKAANLTLAYLIAFIAFNKALRGMFSTKDENLPLAHAFPVILVIFICYSLFGKRRQRSLMYNYIGRVLIAPFGKVEFRDSYIGDILTSTVRVNLQLAFALGYVILSIVAWFENDMALASSNSPHKLWKHSYIYKSILVPILTLLPLWLRFVQCLRRAVETGQRWPHFCNALKYCSAMAVISFSVFIPDIKYYTLWIISFTGATLFQYWWDVHQDWGLLVPRNSPLASGLILPGTDKAVRTPLLMGSVSFYVIIAFINLILRFAWALTLLDFSPDTDNDEHVNGDISSSNEYKKSLFLYNLYPIMAALEVFRRMVWSILRVEWEQIEKEQKNKMVENKDGTSLSSHAMSNLIDEIFNDNDENKFHYGNNNINHETIKGSSNNGRVSEEVRSMSGSERSRMDDISDFRQMDIDGENFSRRQQGLPELARALCSLFTHVLIFIQRYTIDFSSCSFDWYSHDDWWLRRFPIFVTWLYSTQLFRSVCGTGTNKDKDIHLAPTRFLESILFATAMFSLILCTAMAA